jgi:CNT family concentrative nucleoside transporter
MLGPTPGRSIDTATAEELPPPEIPLPPTPWQVRAGIAAVVLLAGTTGYLLHGVLGYRIQAAAGLVCFLGLAAMFSRSLQSVNARTLLWGIGLQFSLAVAVIHSEYVRACFEGVGAVIRAMIVASDRGAEAVFGSLAKVNGPAGLVFAAKALPPIIFVSSLFSVLYYLGVLQFIVKLLARAMMFLMRTSGAETLSVAANVFMGQTEAPLIVKPFVPRMTRSELLTLMASGLAHISGGMMAVYISYGASEVAILTTCVMACPCSLYLSKLILPESGRPLTAGAAPMTVETPYVNVIDAAAAGVKDGLWLALNVAAMLIAFIAFLALFDIILGSIIPGLKLQTIFGRLFAPVAFLIGVDPAECDLVGTLLGIKLAANEHVAYQMLTGKLSGTEPFLALSDRSRTLSVYALTGFANFASVGILLGGIGSIAPNRRADLARLGMTALFIGFLSTLINAAVAALIMPVRM